MRFSANKTALFGVALCSLTMFGCETSTPGQTNTLGSVTTMVDGRPDKVTAAAAKAANDLKLLYVGSAGTKVDGKVTAKTAQGESVNIDIEQAGDNISRVKIRVGATGDEAISNQLIERIKSHLSIL